MMKPKKRGFGAGAGGIMVFTVLSVLCVAVFAVLTMSSALADLRLSEKTALMAKQYYQYDAAGVRLLCRAEELWPENSPAPAEDVMLEGLYDVLLDEHYGEIENAEIWLYQGEDMLSISVSAPVGESRSFEIIALLFSEPDPDTGSRWSIESWSLGSEGFGGEEIDVGMPVWVGKQ